MTFIFIFVAVVLLVLLGFLLVARGHRTKVAALDDLDGQIHPVDLEAFQNLISVNESEFLRRTLSRRDYRAVQRQRMLAAAEYVRSIATNAAILMQLGIAAQSSTELEVARAAREMVDKALRVRMLAMLALMKLYVQSAWPTLALDSDSVFAGYRQLTESAVLFTRLQRPAFAGRVNALL